MLFEPGNKVHFIGIGGAGMSAIAKVLLERGLHVSGSDLKPSRAFGMLGAMGAGVHVGHEADLVEGCDAVVVSTAIPASNVELARARDLGIDVLSRGEALAEVLRPLRPIVVAGTHGKTTTTSMVVSVLRTAGFDPTYLVGAGLNDVGTNAKHGRDELAVAESDESDGSFLLLDPEVAVVTNVEIDHVDYWGSLGELSRAFEQFIARVRDGGAVVVPAGDEGLVAAASASGRAVVTFGDRGDVSAEEVAFDGGEARFLLRTPDATVPVVLRVPGMHNIANALAAAAATLRAGVSPEVIAEGLGAYRGVERRFQVRGQASGVTVIDDYAHHPTEVRATLAAARPGPWRRVVAVFQPHRYSRTKAFAPEFGAAFALADLVVVTDVYGAGELPEPGVTGKLISDAVCRRLPGRPVAYLPHRSELVAYLAATARPGDAVFTLGAGDVSNLGEELLARLGDGRGSVDAGEVTWGAP